MPRTKTVISVPMLIRVIIILTGLVYGLLYHINKIPDELNAAVVVTLLLFITEQFIEVGHKLGVLSATDDERKKIGSFPPRKYLVLGDLLSDTNLELTKILDVQEDRFKVGDPDFAIRSYAHFWRLMAKVQERVGDLKPYHVEAIHSVEMDIWDKEKHPLAEKLIDRQGEFCKLGGSITRILCGHGDMPNGQLCKTYLIMKDAKVNVRYYNIDRGLVDHSFGWDFLRVRETNELVVWDSFGRTPGQVINEAVYSKGQSYEKADIDELWKQLFDHSIPFPDTANEASKQPCKPVEQRPEF